MLWEGLSEEVVCKPEMGTMRGKCMGRASGRANSKCSGQSGSSGPGVKLATEHSDWAESVGDDTS